MPLQSWLHWLLQLFQLKPGKPAIASSLQTLVSVLGPLAIGVWLGHPTGSAIAILGAWFVELVNVEGVYRQQATGKLIALISFTAMLLLANWVHGVLWLSILTTFGVIFLAGFVGVLGQAASAIGLTTSIIFIVALARFATFPDWSTVLLQCLLCFAGGLWSIVLSLGSWQLRPYKPVIQSVANCYGALSQLVNAAAGRVAHLDDRRNQLSQFLKAQDEFTQALNTARDRWAAAWVAQQAANQSANQLLILVEDTPLIANLVVALVEQVVIASDQALFQRSQLPIQQAMAHLAAGLQQMARAIASGKSSVDLGDLDRAIEALNYHQQTLQTSFNQRLIQPDSGTALTNLSRIRDTLAQLANQAHIEVELIATLQRGGSTPMELDRRTVNLLQRMPANPSIMALILVPLRNNLTLHSVLFRHALRIAIVATIAELLAAILQIPRGYWMTLTAVVALKPNYGGTSQTAFQRVMGTVLGGVMGIVIVTLIHNTWVIGGCLLLLIMAAMAVRPLSFSWFVTLLTPAIILLLNVTSHEGWEIGVWRIVDSLAGGILALMGSYLLFPRWERQQLPTQLATTIRANVAYFYQVIATYCPVNETPGNAIAPLRRQAALENTNAVAATQRLFSEPRHVQGNVEPITTLIFYTRRFFNSATALAEHRQDLEQVDQCAELQQFAEGVVQALENAADALQNGALQPLPDLDRPLQAIHNHLRSLHLEELLLAGMNSDIYTALVDRNRTLISANLDQIAYEVRNIHSAIAQLIR